MREDTRINRDGTITLTTGLTTHLGIRCTRMPWGNINSRANGNIVISMSFDVFLQILWTLELFAAQCAFVGFERDVHANVRGNVVTLDRLGIATVPCTDEVEVIGALTANMVLANMFLSLVLEREGREERGSKPATYIELLGIRQTLATSSPVANETGVGGGSRRRGRWRRRLRWSWLLRSLRRA
jgi:hypothetical protein